MDKKSEMLNRDNHDSEKRTSKFDFVLNEFENEARRLNIVQSIVRLRILTRLNEHIKSKLLLKSIALSESKRLCENLFVWYDLHVNSANSKIKSQREHLLKVKESIFY